MIIGITGTNGSGKGTVVDYLVRQRGFVHCSARTLIVSEIKRREMQINRDNTRLVGNDLRRLHGNDFVVAHYIQVQKQKQIADVVIESIRTIAEVESLKNSGGILLAVDADPQIRYDRISERKTGLDQIPYEKFLAQEEIEMNDPDPNGMQKAKVMEMADYTIVNNGTLEALHAQIEDVLSTIEENT